MEGIPNWQPGIVPTGEGASQTDKKHQNGTERIAEVAKIMDIQMKNYDSWTENLHINTQGKASQLFNKAYKPKDSGIYGNED